MVLTYNFTNCDFTKIKEDYEKLIVGDFQTYINGTKSTQSSNYIFCSNQSDCLAKIESLTFGTHAGCGSLSKEMFACRTKATFAHRCPDYPRVKVNNTQAMKKRKKREDTAKECLKHVLRLQGLWRRFTRAP
ncbi:Thymic stromal lymphopoietin [Tupaia chinensis]|uniref:Thymic stromal lymphopoietin n=1 Tax=Tupaia chinensis TaxID=246437 RepID=L8YGS5_TUPCH|nr:Thymic stromal lymphopoietin [Tupaia chinensis]